MHTPLAHILVSATLLFWMPLPGLADPSKRDLVIELRQVRDDQLPAGTVDSAYTVSTATLEEDFTPQQVRVRSGEKASLVLNHTMALQWVQKVEFLNTTLRAASASASGQAGGITRAVTLVESGQDMAVTAHWAGGKLPVKLEIDLQMAVVAPLDQWVTLASSGKSASAGSYRSTGGSATRRLLQVRVTTP
jgi:hypothetical protein